MQYVSTVLSVCVKASQLGMLLANVERACLLVTAIHVLLDTYVDAETFTLGYITGSKRRPGDFEYHRPGFRISGAMTLAVEEASNRAPVVTYYRHRPQLAFARKWIIKFNNSNRVETRLSPFEHRLREIGAACG